MQGITSKTPVAISSVGERFEHDPHFKGPVKQRSCTDVLCLFLFISFLAGWAVVAIFAFRHGDPNILIYPTDSEGNICGLYGFKSRPYLFFFDLTACAKPSVVFKGCQTPQVCVEHCPNETFYIDTSKPASEHFKDKLICKYDADRTRTVADLVDSKECAPLYLASKPLVGRCIPEVLRTKGDLVLDIFNETLQSNGQDLGVDIFTKASEQLAKFLSAKEIGEKIYCDLKTAWAPIVIGLVSCMLLSLIWIILMRWVAGIMVWLSIILVIALCSFALYYSITMYIDLKSRTGTHPELAFTLNLKSYLAVHTTWLIFAIVSGSILLILLLILLFLRERINIAISLIREGSKAVGSMISCLIFPIIPYVIKLSVLVFAAAVAIYIASAGKATFLITNAGPGSSVKDGTECDPMKFNATDAKCSFLSYGDSGNIRHGQWYNLFAVFWCVFFMIGVNQVTLAGAFASYYWTIDKSDIDVFPVSSSLYRCLRYHMGSVAFGSLLLATVSFIRAILEYVDHKCKKYDNAVTRAILCCLKCCFWCLAKFLKFISKNAYIMVAVYGKNFCVAAKMACGLLMRNVVRVVVLDKVTDFLLFIGKLVIVGASAVTSFYIFSGRIKYFETLIPPLNYNLLPVVVITIGSYMIASLFFNVYGMAVDTLFLCFLEDCERNDGSAEKPYCMPKDLMKILGKQNKFVDPVTVIPAKIV